MSVISNLPTPVELVIKQVHDYVKMRLTSQLINDISIILQKLLKFLKGTIISTFFLLQSLGVFPVIFILSLNDSESVKLSFRSSM